MTCLHLPIVMRDLPKHDTGLLDVLEDTELLVFPETVENDHAVVEENGFGEVLRLGLGFPFADSPWS